MLDLGNLQLKISVDDGELNILDNKLGDLENHTEDTATSIRNTFLGMGLERIFEKAFSVIKASMDDAISRFDTMSNFPRVMQNLGISAEDAQGSIDTLAEGLKGLPTTIDSAASSVQRLTSKNKDINKSTEYYLALNNALLAGGSSMQAQESAMEQMMQAYSRGKFEAEEWKSLLTTMPAQLDQVAQAFGMSTEQLKEGLDSGNITMDEFLDKFVELNDKGVNGMASFSQQAKDATKGIGTSIEGMKTSVVRNLADVIGAIDGDDHRIAQAFDHISDVIDSAGKFISENLVEVGVSLGVLASALTANKLMNGWNDLAKAMKNTPVKAFGKDFGNVAGIVSKAGPWAIGAAAVLGVAAGIKSAYDETHKYRKEVQDLTKDYENNVASIEKQAEYDRMTADNLEVLAEKREKTNGDLALEQSYIDTLNERYPELNLSMDETGNILDNNGNKVKDLTDLVYDNVDAWEENALAQAKQNVLSEYLEEQIKLTQEHKDALKEKKEAQEQYNKEAESGNGVSKTTIDRLKEATDKERDSASALDDLNGKIDGIKSNLNDADGMEAEASLDVDTKDADKKIDTTTAAGKAYAKSKYEAKMKADNKDATKKTKEAQDKATKFGDTKATATLKVQDNASGTINSVLDKLKNFAKKTFTATVKTKNSTTVPSGNRIGLKEVPYDGYEAYLHKGEVVLTASEANMYDKFINGLDRTNSVATMSSPVVIDYDKLADVLIDSLSNVTNVTNVNLDKKVLVSETAPLMSKEMNKISIRENRLLGVR